ncbi:MAG TPA: DUF4932 domain-containing protein [Kofleriaceae bacterium]
MKLLWLVVAVACSSSSAPPPTPGSTMPISDDAATPAAATTEVRVDRRVELISILFRLGGGDEYRLAPPSPYLADVEKAFRPFADHPAVAATRELKAKHSISFDAPMHLAIRLDDKLALIDEAGVRTGDPRWKDVDVAGYVAKLREFAEASKFDAFVTAHAAHYAAVADKLRKAVDAEQPVAWFDSQFGPRQSTRYIVVPGLLNGSRNFGLQAKRADGTIEMFQILGVTGTDGMPATDDDSVGLLVHEMAHSYVNPLFEQHHGKLAASGAAIFALVEKRMRAQQYMTWQTTLNEAGVRALTVVYMGVKKGQEAGRIALKQELRNGFVWTDELARLIFRRDLKQTPTVTDLMPDIIALFDELAARYATQGIRRLPFLGPAFAVLQTESTWVTPSDAELARHVTAVQQKFFSARQLVAGDATTLDTTKGRGLVAWGTAKSNPIVAAVIAKHGWKVSTDGIDVAGKKFAGPHLALIATRPRPDDPARGILVYTAATDADLIHAFSVRHGFHDWQIIRKVGTGFETVATGDFAD